MTGPKPLGPVASSAIDLQVPPKEQRDWLFIIFQIGGHGLEDDFDRMNRSLASMGTTKNAHIAIRAEGKNGTLVNYFVQHDDPENDGHLERYASEPAAAKFLKRPILDKFAMASFLIEAARLFPANHIMVAFEGHSGQLRKAVKDTISALREFTATIGNRVDVLLKDSCFMAQIEYAVEVMTLTSLLAASQEGVVRFRPFPTIATWVKPEGGTTPVELATQIVKKNEEFAFSLTDLEKLRDTSGLLGRIEELGKVILGIKDNKALAEIRKAIKRTTGYYTEGLFGRHTYFSSTVDFKGFVMNITKSRYLRSNFYELINACEAVLKAFGKEGEGVILKERHARKVDQYVLDVTDVRGSNGLSIHMPIWPAPFRNRYTHFKNSAFDRITNWDAVTDHITSTRTPLYMAASAIGFAFGGFVTALNNGIQFVMEKWEGFKWRQKQRSGSSSPVGSL